MPRFQIVTHPVPATLPAPSAVDDLVVEHLPLARYAAVAVSRRLQLPPHVNQDDLFASAQVALVEAARRYDPSLGASFATYVRPRLQGAILDELRSVDWATRSVRAEARRLAIVTETLTGELGASPTRAQVAQRLGVSDNDLDALRDSIARANVGSIDANPDQELAGAASAQSTPEDTVLHRERVGCLLDAIEALPDRLGEVIERNFFNDEPLTAIAVDLGVTLSRVSQMRSRALCLLHAAISEVLDGQQILEAGGSRARAQQRDYVEQVVATSGDYRTRLATMTRRAG